MHQGKGAKDRFVPLPRATLTILRAHWRSHQSPAALSGVRPRRALGRDRHDPDGQEQCARAFRHAKRTPASASAGVGAPWHCYATHLLEAGVNPRVIQRHMGRPAWSTMLYLHLTHKGTRGRLPDRPVMEGL
jgi:site-specific recombinase XerD